MDEQQSPPWDLPPDPLLADFGDIGVGTHSVYLPHGPEPIAGTSWSVQVRTDTHRTTSTVGYVLAVALFFVMFLFSLLFLLIREERWTDYVEVTVRGDGFEHTTRELAGVETLNAAHDFVEFARTLSCGADEPDAD